VRNRIEWVIDNCRLLQEIGDDFERAQPFGGLRIGTGIHLEPKTVALLLTLRRGGAHVVSTGNLNTTQQEAVDYLASRGVTVVGGPTSDPDEHDSYLRDVLAHEPELILDNGGDLFVRYLERPYAGLRGGTEETTSGRTRLEPLRPQLALPVLVINDSPIKLFVENHHAVGQSIVESFLRITNRATNGRRATVVGYGSCGKGIAAYLRDAHAIVSVFDVDPVVRLQAMFDGFLVPERDDALASADVIVTATGAARVLTADDLPLLKSGALLMNAGHFPWEIDVAALEAHASVVSAADYTDGIRSLTLDDGRMVGVLTGGHMVNLAGPRPLGNSIESMDLGFALQARCLEAVAGGSVGSESCVVPVPRGIDEAVAAAYVATNGARNRSTPERPPARTAPAGGSRPSSRSPA
jgi:adenosylhomocysteinase